MFNKVFATYQQDEQWYQAKIQAFKNSFPYFMVLEGDSSASLADMKTQTFINSSSH
jgi:hypothetical protein